MTESKGNYSKGINARVIVLALCTSSTVDLFFMKFREDSLDNFQATEWTRFCDRVQGK